MIQRVFNSGTASVRAVHVEAAPGGLHTGSGGAEQGLQIAFKDLLETGAVPPLKGKFSRL
ncbi:hypothetical protein AGMMS49579_12380 [Spirochaetia bacterium]|nr:hypothetical protein AGMMS49579_12380 [Spirochaetia bacterium]